jgi:hypothetical protein
VARLSLGLILLGASLSGCVAETVRKEPPRKGPVREVGYVDTGGGEVRYSMDGWSWFVAGRRRDALRRMRKVCQRLHAVVVDEFIRDDADVPYSQDDIIVTLDRGSDHYSVAPYTHIEFECSESTAPIRPAVLISTSPTVSVSTESTPVPARQP